MAGKQQILWRWDNAFSMPTFPFHHKTQMHSHRKQGQTVAVSLQGTMDHKQLQSTPALIRNSLSEDCTHLILLHQTQRIPTLGRDLGVPMQIRMYIIQHTLFCKPLSTMNQDCNHHFCHGHQNCNDQKSSLDPLEVVFFLFTTSFLPFLSLVLFLTYVLNEIFILL